MSLVASGGCRQSLTRRRVTPDLPLWGSASTFPSSDRDTGHCDLTLTCLIISAKTLFLNEVTWWGSRRTWLLGDSSQPGDTAVTNHRNASLSGHQGRVPEWLLRSPSRATPLPWPLVCPKVAITVEHLLWARLYIVFCAVAHYCHKKPNRLTLIFLVRQRTLKVLRR